MKQNKIKKILNLQKKKWMGGRKKERKGREGRKRAFQSWNWGKMVVYPEDDQTGHKTPGEDTKDRIQALHGK